MRCSPRVSFPFLSFSSVLFSPLRLTQTFYLTYFLLVAPSNESIKVFSIISFFPSIGVCARLLLFLFLERVTGEKTENHLFFFFFFFLSPSFLPVVAWPDLALAGLTLTPCRQGGGHLSVSVPCQFSSNDFNLSCSICYDLVEKCRSCKEGWIRLDWI